MDISRRKRKASRKQLENSPLIINGSIKGWKLTIANSHGEMKSFDFSSFAEKRPELAKHFFEAFCGLQVEHNGRAQCLDTVRKFWLFLDHTEQANVLTKLSDINLDAVEKYLHWLSMQRSRKGGFLGSETQRFSYSNIKRLLKWLIVHKRGECSKELSFPHNVFCGAARKSKSRNSYSKAELNRLMKAIEEELEHINARIENRYVKQNIGRDPRKRHTKPSLWKDWENLVWYFENVFNCKPKTTRWISREGHSSFTHAVRRYHGGQFAVQERLGLWTGTSQQVLLPFLLLFAIVTGANPDPILEMQRDCVKEDALMGHKYVIWHKRRGKSIQKSWSPSARLIVERVLELTKDLVPEAGNQANYLWLVPGRNGTGRRLHIAQPNKFKAFIEKYKLKADDGSPLRINLSRLRPTFASRAYEICNGDLVKLRTLMGHSRISTTQRYVHHFDREQEEDRAFNGLTNIVEATKNGSLISRYAVETKSTEKHVLKQLKGQTFYTGLGHCLDPYKSPMLGERTENRCRLFWSCLTCRHTLILDSDLPSLLSHYNTVEKFRKHMTVEAFEETYAWILKIIDCDILPKFEKEIVNAAREKAKNLTESLNIHEMVVEELERE